MYRPLLAALLLVPLSLALAGCTALTKPDEIRVVAESITLESGPTGGRVAGAGQPASPGGSCQ